MRFVDLVENLAAHDLELRSRSRFKNLQGKLDYEGSEFETLAILQQGRPIGEVTIQSGPTTVTVRNVILYRDADTGKGIGKAVYAELVRIAGKRKLRSSYSTNTSGDQTTTGLSDQAIAMWDSLTKRGQARRIESGDRFYYSMNEVRR